MKEIMICLSLFGMLQPPGWQARVVQRPVPQRRALQAGGNSYRWYTATFKGLTIGRATRRNMLRLLGKPTWSELMRAGESGAEWWYHYKSADPAGELVVVVDRRSSLILRIDLYPEHLLRDEITKYFGDDFIVTRYDFDECLGDEESAPLYESPDGSIISVEYRRRGIAIAVNYQNKVDHISYVSSPIGASESRCKGRRGGPGQAAASEQPNGAR